MLIASRALLGIAGATLAPSTLSLIFAMFSGPKGTLGGHRRLDRQLLCRQRHRPVLGGIMLEYFWWGSAFLVALPVMAALLVLGPRVLPEYRDPAAGRLDLPSAALSVAGVLAAIYGLKEIASIGGNRCQPLRSSGLAIGAVFVRRQQRLEDPMIDIRLFAIRAFNAALAVNFLAIFVAVGILPVHRAVPAAGQRDVAARSRPVVAALGLGLHRRLPAGAAHRRQDPPHVLIGGDSPSRRWVSCC